MSQSLENLKSEAYDILASMQILQGKLNEVNTKIASFNQSKSEAPEVEAEVVK